MGCSSSSTTIDLTGFSTLIHPGGCLSGSGAPKLPAMQEDRTFEAPCKVVVPAGLRREIVQRVVQHHGLVPQG